MRIRKCLAAAVFFLISACIQAQEIQVAVAANLQFVFDDLQQAYQKQSGQRLRAVFNSSGKLASQIANGAPFDLFISADTDYPFWLKEKKLTLNEPKTYALGALVLWSTRDLKVEQWQDLIRQKKITKMAIANPKTSPYGREAMNALQHLKLVPEATNTLVYAESIAQVNQYIHSGVVELGITAKSVVLSAEMRHQGRWVNLPEPAYQKIAQAAVILPHARGERLAKAQSFFDFLYSPAARSIFEQHGYQLP